MKYILTNVLRLLLLYCVLVGVTEVLVAYYTEYHISSLL